MNRLYEARAIYAEAIKLQGISWGCVRSVACRSPSEVKDCPECSKYMNLNRELDSLLGLKPWETSPLDASQKNTARLATQQLDQSEYWRKAWAMRCELEARLTR